MSASPSLPSTSSREAGQQRGDAPSLLVSNSGVYRERPPPPPPPPPLQQGRGGQQQQQLQQQQQQQHLPPPRPYSGAGAQGRGAQGVFQPSDQHHQHHHHHHHHSTSLYGHQPPFQQPSHPVEGPFSVSATRPPTDHSYSPTKSQRKTKGHVASACVPCKRAHLRCDAKQGFCNGHDQRQGKRGLTVVNGKEDACVDVQHKKRGRPRLRDDREARFDPLRPPPQYPDLSLRRPLNAFAQGGAPGPDERHASSYGPPLDAPSVTLPSRPFDRAAAAGPEPAVYGSSSSASMPPGYPEPVAYLTMGMEFAKASPTFIDAVGGLTVTGRKLSDVIAGSEVERTRAMQNRLVAEQKRREPNYLPPILGLGGPAFQGVGFTVDDVARFPLTIQEQLTFVGPDGYQRPYPLRVGLGKEGSFYFVVMLLLGVPARYPHPRLSTVSSYPGMPGPYEGAGPGPPAFDPVRHRLSEGAGPPTALRPSTLSAQNPSSRTASPGVMAPASPYSGGGGGTPSTRTRYSGPQPEPLPSFAAGRSTQGRIQLPPIRSQSERQPSSAWQRDERTGRVDIGGLLDKSEGSGKPR
ncbi:hypothetical protein CDD80_5657 [Ophiocordyceps camponoti-rufipedis]|uniref:Zn(2)-C6 fungal-type domain-containing protein n=1 Tax=Ophiocordyceps camponoti-rufipedis TaxID=2004952 RepID=A0A2C5YT65_9HYPO|nr:hypothetical protein CDD80_5657 [Ophiocordyceps camponoti-rufipedis]